MVADWLTAIGTVATAAVAWWAFLSWRKPLRSASQHAAAEEIAEAVRLLWHHLYDARSPWIAAGEYPREYYEKDRHSRSNQDEARGLAHVYDERWKILWPQILRIATLRAKAGALLDDEVEKGLEALAKCADGLHDSFSWAVKFERDGRELVAQYSDQTWVARVRAAVAVDRDKRDDVYSKEFEEAYGKVVKSLKKYL